MPLSTPTTVTLIDFQRRPQLPEEPVISIEKFLPVVNIGVVTTDTNGVTGLSGADIGILTAFEFDKNKLSSHDDVPGRHSALIDFALSINVLPIAGHLSGAE